MYDASKIAERLDIAERNLGWRPVYHSVKEVAAINRRLEDIAIRTDTGKPTGETTRPFTEEEKWWIRNERNLCASDASYFLTRYAYIKNDANQIVRFQFRNPQRVYFKVIAALERRGAAIQLQVLKGRQLGVSTITELLVCHRICFGNGVNAVIASSAQQPTQIMSQMIFLCYDNLPYWLKPQEKTRKESEQGQLTFTTSSGVVFQHGSQTTGIARGHTPTCVHLSECASFPHPEELVDASLFRAVHESEQVFMVLESTAEGVDNWWHKTWKASKAGWEQGRSRLCPLFLPWYLGTEMYPKPTWLRTRPVPADWIPNKETKARMAKAKAFVAAIPVLAEVLGENWEMGAEQAWFSEVDYEEYKAKGREKLWQQEMAGDDVECFQGSYDSVFGNDLLRELHQARKKDYRVYGLKGHGIETKFEPADAEIDFDLPRPRVQYANNRGILYRWEMIPLYRGLIEDEDSNDLETAELQAQGKLLVFLEPEPGQDYTVGVDTGGGAGGDSTVIEVWRKGMNGMPDVQCAEFSSAYVSHVEAYAFIMAIAARYSLHMGGEDSRYREPLVSIEQIAAVGDTCQPQMRLMGYSRFFKFHFYDTKEIKPRKSNKMGWRTSGWSRPVLVDGFVHSVKNEWLILHSPFLLREMSKFEIHTKNGRERKEHAAEDHDDRIFASAIAVFTSHDMEAMVERGKHKPMIVSDRNRPDLDLEPIGLGRLDSMLRQASQQARVEKITTTQQLDDYFASERLAY